VRKVAFTPQAGMHKKEGQGSHSHPASEARVIGSVRRRGKPCKRFPDLSRRRFTWLKPGVNETGIVRKKFDCAFCAFLWLPFLIRVICGQPSHEFTIGRIVPSMPSTKFPEWIKPMAATLTQERFTGPEWIFERKFDGIRLIAFKQGPDVRLYSRNRLPQNLPPLAQAIAKLPHRELILDGEITWHGPLRYDVFDILWIDGRDVTALPIEERRALLSELPLTAPMQRVETLDDEMPWERAQKEGWEGVIAKRRGSLYESRRSPHWLKMKCELSQNFVVGGFTDPQGKRVGLGALLVGYYDGADFVFAGKIGTGFDTRLLLDLRAQLDKLEMGKTPFTKAVGLPRLRAHWVDPKIVVEVGFIEWTVHGKLRHPRLLRVRNDKPARDVVKE
jgi:ATP-dependent DNA ligase